MSTSGVFRIIANEGKIDRMIMASDLLKQRIADIRRVKSQNGDPDPTPSIPDLEKSHIIFVNAHYKPFAAIGFEYNKVQSGSGLASNLTESSVNMQFSIPQFGDFFHDMVLRTRIGQVRADARTLSKADCDLLPNPAGPDADLPNQDNVDTMVGDVPVAIYDSFGTPLIPLLTDNEGLSINWANVNNFNYTEYVRYVEYPANRFYANVKFSVNGNPLDEYDYKTSNMLDKFTVAPNKKLSHDILCGQEVPMTGYSGLRLGNVVDKDVSNGSYHTPSGSIDRNASDQSNRTLSVLNPGRVGLAQATVVDKLPTSISRRNKFLKNKKLGTVGDNTIEDYQTPQYGADNFAFNVSNAPFVPSNTKNFDISREVKQFVNGPQTAKPVQPALELWSRLRFWFNEDVRLSVPSVSIPFGQRFVDVTTATVSDILTTAPSLYLGYYPKTAFGSSGTAPEVVAATTMARGIRYVEIPAKSTVRQAPINQVEMYINNIFVNNEVHDIYIERIGFSLIRVYRSQSATFSNSAVSSQLTSLKWPVEYMYVGLQPSYNVNKGNNVNYYRDWHRYTRQVDVSVGQLTGEVNQYIITPTDYNLPTDPNAPSGGALSKKSKTTKVINLEESDEMGAKDVPDWNVVGGENDVVTSAATALLAPVVNDHYWLSMSTIDRLSVTSHGIKLYDNFSDMFFSQYMPFHYGGSAVMSSPDEGALFINLALCPRTYQPSGHLNLSRARETYIDIQSKYCSSATPCELFVQALCINFLLYAEGSASLRYST